MIIAAIQSNFPGETRAPLTPDATAKLVKLGAQVEIESGLGLGAGYADAQYVTAGATVATDRRALLTAADLVLRIRKPSREDISLLKTGSIHASLLDAFNERELINQLATQGVSAISMELIPRTTRRKWMCFPRRRISAVTWR